MKKNLFIKILLVVICSLLLLNLIADLLPLQLFAKAITRYKVERVITVNKTGASSQLWIKINNIMKTYMNGTLISVVKHTSDDKEAVWFLIIKVW